MPEQLGGILHELFNTPLYLVVVIAIATFALIVRLCRVVALLGIIILCLGGLFGTQSSAVNRWISDILVTPPKAILVLDH